MKALLIYSSREGQTKSILSVIAEQLRGNNIEVDLYDIDSLPAINFAHYSGVLIGASIRYGYFSKTFKAFVNEHYESLNQLPSAFISVSLIARKAEKQTVQTNRYTSKFLSSTKWKPTMCGVFAGALRYPRYSLFDRIMIQLIMKMTKGETDSTKDIEYTDWQKVKVFGAEFEALMEEKGLS